MKRKLFLSLLTLVLCFGLVLDVKAASNSIHNITVASKAIELQPDEDESIYAVLDENEFVGFEKVSFKPKSGTEKVEVKDTISEFSKILITNTANLSTTLSQTGILFPKATALAGSNYFTAYCLDGTLQYPHFSLQNFGDSVVPILLSQTYSTTYGGAMAGYPEYDQQLGVAAMLALANNAKFNPLLTNYVKGKGYSPYPVLTYTVVGGNGVQFEVDLTKILTNTVSPVADANFATDYAIAGQTLQTLMAMNEVTINVVSIKYKSLNGGEDLTVTPTHLASVDPTNVVDGVYKLKFNGKDIMLDKYSFTSLSGTNDYNHALWIIEHSYPSMSLNDFLTAAGANLETLKTQIKDLYPDETFTDEEMTNLVDNYVYYTIQHAIWYANDSDPYGGIGDELYLGTLEGNNELNTIYKYLIKARDEYTNYGNKTYKNEIVLDTTNNDEVEEEGDYYIYGPYTATYSVIEASAITLDTNSKEGVSIVDADGNKLTTVTSGQEFYVKCKKSAKVTDLKLKLSATGKNYTDNGKGTIYYANHALSQNVITGASYEDVTYEKTFELTYNPKTGVANVAIVFVISLIAFSLGYLVLSYKNKPVELN